MLLMEFQKSLSTWVVWKWCGQACGGALGLAAVTEQRAAHSSLGRGARTQPPHLLCRGLRAWKASAAGWGWELAGRAQVLSPAPSSPLAVPVLGSSAGGGVFVLLRSSLLTWTLWPAPLPWEH